MKLYLYFNTELLDSKHIDRSTISFLAQKHFHKDVSFFDIQACNNLMLKSSPLAYYCVIDDKFDGDVLSMKRNFTEEIRLMFKSKVGTELNGVVKIQTGFQPEKDIINTKKLDNSCSINTNDTDQEFDYEKRAEMYKPTNPSYTFDRVILPPIVLEKIEESLAIVECEDTVFKNWGLSVIQPNPSSALSFYGPSGTGKTMAAEAIADKLGKKILKVSYADIESKFHGEGPKMVKAIFLAAQKEDAVLFIDEADSLLSKRLTNVQQGSEQAINSMRSQLLICLEEFKGIVIFATNLVVNYDQAFLTRLISVEFIKPDNECRKKIWDVHIRGNGINIPLFDDVDTNELAEKYEFCGREIRKAVINACVSVAMHNRFIVQQADFIKACDKIKYEEERLANAEDHTKSKKNNLSPQQEDVLKDAIKAKIKQEKENS
ncbi:MAG: ATP-binding protein [Oscillospiraceae bacterium]